MTQLSEHGSSLYDLWVLQDVWILRKIETIELLDRRMVQRSYSYDIDLDVVRSTFSSGVDPVRIDLPLESVIRQNFLSVDLSSPWPRQTTLNTRFQNAQKLEIIMMEHMRSYGVDIDSIPYQDVKNFYNYLLYPNEYACCRNTLKKYYPTTSSLSFEESKKCEDFLLECNNFLQYAEDNYLLCVSVPNDPKVHRFTLKLTLLDGSGNGLVRRGCESMLGGPFISPWVVSLGPFGHNTTGYSRIICPQRTNVLKALVPSGGVRTPVIDIASNHCQVLHYMNTRSGQGAGSKLRKKVSQRDVGTASNALVAQIYPVTSRSYFAIPAFFIVLFSWILALLFLKSNQRIDGALSVTICVPPIAAVFLLLLEEHEVVSIALTGPRLLLVSSLFLTVSAGLFNSPEKGTNQFSFAHNFMVVNYYIHTLLVCYFLSSLYVPELYKRINRSARYLRVCSLLFAFFFSFIIIFFTIYLHLLT